MPNFTDPFPGMKQTGDLDTHEITRALRLDIAAEEDATHIYTAQADRITIPAVKRTLLDIADEERVHAGELLRLIQEVDDTEAKFMAQGMREVEEREHLEHEMVVEMMADHLKSTGRSLSEIEELSDTELGKLIGLPP
jgi:rubrerythrin